MKAPLCKITPIGGVKEIGSNITLYQTATTSILIDCGILFPYDQFYDLNYLIPNFDYLDGKKINDIVITHGHEDHIGAIGHLILRFPHLKIHAAPFAAELIRAKLDRFKLKHNFNIFKPGESLKIGDITVNTIHVNHSIPETMGLHIQTAHKELGTTFISDFKMDKEDNPYELKFDLERLKKLCSENKKNLFMLDSTNILVPGKTLSEREVKENLEKWLTSSKRIFLTMFSSNTHRIQAIYDIATKYNKKVCLLGRSLYKYTEAAMKAGVMPKCNFYEPDQIDTSKRNIIFIATGCQGDFFGALRRLSDNEFARVRLQPEDLFIFSSKVIPGNEKQVFRIQNKLIDLGAEVVTARDDGIHASGHPGQEDLKNILNEVQPDFYIPIHGESLFLKRHIDFIKENYPNIEPIELRNFTEVRFSEDFRIDLNKGSELEPILIHGGNYLEIERDRVSDRRKLATMGLIIANINLKAKNVDIQTKGLPRIFGQEIEKITNLALDFAQKNKDPIKAAEEARIAIRKYSSVVLGYKPITLVSIT